MTFFGDVDFLLILKIHTKTHNLNFLHTKSEIKIIIIYSKNKVSKMKEI